LRLSGGAGYFHSSASYGGVTRTLSGVGPAMNFACGGAVLPNLIIFGELSASAAMDPTVNATGSSSTTATDTTVNLYNFGPGVAYYIESLNLYLSGAVTLAWMTADNSNNNSNNNSQSTSLTDTGIGGSFMVGKEWWVSANWGLGVAGMLNLASMKDKTVDTRWFTTSVSFLFSATYN
jgi:hypothetical protein